MSEARPEQHGALGWPWFGRPRAAVERGGSATAAPTARAALSRHTARAVVLLSGAATIYVLIRAAREVVARWQNDAPLQYSYATLVQGGAWKLAAYLAAVFGLAVLSGRLLRVGQVANLPFFRQVGNLPHVLLAVGWILLLAKLCRKWYALAHDGMTCDAVLIGLAMLFLLVALAGAVVGVGRRRFAAIQDRWLLAALGLLWLAILFAANQLTALLSVAATLTVSAAIGWCFLQRVGLLQDMDRLCAVLFCVGLGSGAVALGTLALGHLHLLYWWIVVPLYAIVLAATGILPVLRQGIAGLQAGEPRRSARGCSERSGDTIPGLTPGARRAVLASHPLWLALAVMLAVLLTACLVGNLGPEVFSDGIIGRLGAPLMYVQSHAIKPRPNILYTYSTCGSEMLVTQAILLGGGAAAGKLMHFSLGILALVAVFAFGRAWRGWRVGLLATFAVGSASLIWWLLTTAYTDLTFLFYGVLASFALYRWLERRQTAWLVVCGLLIGLAGGVKLTGGLLAVAALPVVCMASAGKARLRNSLLLGLCALVGVLPWLVRTYCYTGNPVWPWMICQFDPTWPEWMPVGYHFSPGSSLHDYLTIADRVAFKPQLYMEVGGYSPILLALLPAILGVVLAARHKAWFAAYALLATALWIVSDINLRYGLVQMAVLSVVGAGVLVGSWRLCERPLRRISQALVVVAAAGGMLFVLFHESHLKLQDGTIFAYKPLLGLLSANEHAERLLPTRALSNYLNRTYGPHARVWSMVHMDVLVQQAESFAWVWLGKQPELARLMEAQTSSEEIYAGLLDLGITHLVCSEAELRNPTGNPWYGGPFSGKVVTDPRCCELEYATKGYYLYRLLPPDVAADSPCTTAVPAVPARMDAAGTPLGLLSGDDCWQQTVPVREGSLYRLTVRAKGDSPTSAVRADFWWRRGNDVPVYEPYHTPIRVGDGAREIVRYETAPLGARTLTIKVFGVEPGEIVQVEDVRLAVMEDRR